MTTTTTKQKTIFTIPLGKFDKIPIKLKDNPIRFSHDTPKENLIKNTTIADERFQNGQGNYGILTGVRNGFFVVDYDIYKKVNICVTRETLKKAHGNDAYIVRTGNGGFHVYHNYTDKVSHWWGATGIDGYIDIRTDGNYIVGAGSEIIRDDKKKRNIQM